jgi:phosphoribosylformylglycinamidine synthase subunit PurS
MTEISQATLWLARVVVTLKSSVVDPQGDTILTALHQLHFDGVQGVRVGKLLEVQVRAADHSAATEAVEAMCRTLLANPVIEHYTFDVTPAPTA